MSWLNRQSLWRRYRQTPVYGYISAKVRHQSPLFIGVVFFLGGVGLELVKIHWRPSGINYYDVRRRKAVENFEMEFRDHMHAAFEDELKMRRDGGRIRPIDVSFRKSNVLDR